MDRNFLTDDKQTGAGVGLDELREMIGHGRQIVRYEDAAFLRCERQYFGIIKATQIRNVRALEIDLPARVGGRR